MCHVAAAAAACRRCAEACAGAAAALHVKRYRTRACMDRSSLYRSGGGCEAQEKRHPRRSTKLTPPAWFSCGMCCRARKARRKQQCTERINPPSAAAAGAGAPVPGALTRWANSAGWGGGGNRPPVTWGATSCPLSSMPRCGQGGHCSGGHSQVELLAAQGSQLAMHAGSAQQPGRRAGTARTRCMYGACCVATPTHLRCLEVAEPVLQNTAETNGAG